MQAADAITALPIFLAGVGLGGAIAALAAGALARRARQRGAARLSALAHDLRTPLSSIAAYSEILQDEDEPDERPRFLEIIHAEAGRIDRMISDRLDIGPAPRVRSGSAGTPGTSSTASMTAPAASPAPVPAGAASPASPSRSRTVLVVDDDRFIVEATRSLLARAGFQALGAAGGEEALLQARAERPDLILMDLRMPSMGGDEALRRLRSDPLTRRIPVIITTGDADGPAPEGAAAILTKPISREALLDAVARAMTGGTR